VLVLSIYRGLCSTPYTWFPMPLELWEPKGEEQTRMEKTEGHQVQGIFQWDEQRSM